LRQEPCQPNSLRGSPAKQLVSGYSPDLASGII
jgi:hypothetical protein